MWYDHRRLDNAARDKGGEHDHRDPRASDRATVSDHEGELTAHAGPARRGRPRWTSAVPRVDRMASADSPDASALRALGHPLRMRLLTFITERGESSPVEMARALDRPLATVSH